MVIDHIVARTTNNCIGLVGVRELLWHIPSDMKRFKEITSGYDLLLCGLSTFQTLPILSGRKVAILTDWSRHCVINHSVQPYQLYTSIDQLPDARIIVIGGKYAYDATADVVNGAHVTQLNYVPSTTEPMVTYDIPAGLSRQNVTPIERCPKSGIEYCFEYWSRK